ncbi:MULTISPECIES: AraC family transcriptional regulator [Roseobacteraceae]|uniref:HTH-type transcriptional regulator NimR n=1 Tax=Pseudosulfitobacter pseudonitzschiae TaxID=1402135 RepID=A0A221K678_9RHOB|nr:MULTISPECIES: AraC family transcriptional regulator [Roseobacteraceae]ASM74357.1 HTH-type transcriptional regulator NimR [Pseudosulfitobacter pseudonitzschiae]
MSWLHDSPTVSSATAPIIARVSYHKDSINGRTHSHDRAQFILAVTQPARLTLPGGDLVLKSGMGAWLPERILHKVSARNGPMFHSLYIEPELANKIPLRTGPIEPTPLLSHMITRLVTLSEHEEAAAVYPHLVALILAELEVLASSESATLVLPDDQQLRRICETLLHHPADGRTLDDWATVLGSSRRRLERHFAADVGMTF